MRDRLPPLFTLQAFEVAARLGNFSRAAAELQLTPGAVSRQVRQLEDWSGQTLFERRGGGMQLTAEGRDLLARLGGPLAALHDAVNPDVGHAHPTLQIATLGSLAHAWLVPRLASFIAREPGFRLIVHTEYSVVRPPPRVAMVALRYGLPGDAGSELLFEDRLLAVATPALANRLGLDAGRWPATSLLNHLNSDHGLWLATAGGPAVPEGLTFNDAGVMVDAACAGLGLAVSRLSIALPGLAAGSLVLAHPLVLKSPRSNLLVVREDSAALPAVRAFTRWLREQAAETARAIHAFDDADHPWRAEPNYTSATST